MRFEERFYRGLQSKPSVEDLDLDIKYAPKDCPECGAKTIHPLCFDCDIKINGNPYSFGVSIEVGSEDSTDPNRIQDGTAHFNAGLPGVEKVVGMRPDGKPRLEYRPVSNNELATARARREYAKTHGCEPVHDKIKRAVGGR